ncbi:MAG: DUF2017 domain-containing protein [Micropruina sp.]|nr:DUF2017 domain-containing protein [Micropruina sp.]
MTRIKRRGSQLKVTMGEYEASILDSLAEQLIELLEADQLAHPAEDPFARWEAELVGESELDTSDPVIARLFPAAYRDDPAAEADFRRYTQTTERRTKIAQARLVRDALAESDLGRSPVLIRLIDSDAWLKTINGLRLSLGVRLGVESADDLEELEALPEDDPRHYVLSIFNWLGGLLESLIDVLD